MRNYLFATLALMALPAIALTAPAQAQDLTGTLKKVKETGYITLGHRESSVPFSYIDDNAKVVGYAMDICGKIVDAVKGELKMDKLEVRLLPVTSSTRIPLLANGTIDLECGSTTNNAERRQKVAFTVPHYIAGARYLVRADSPVDVIRDFKELFDATAPDFTPYYAQLRGHEPHTPWAVLPTDRVLHAGRSPRRAA